MTSFSLKKNYYWYHNLSFKTNRKSKQTVFYFFEGVVDTEGANDDVIFSICGGVCSVWDNFSYLELNQLFYLFERRVIRTKLKVMTSLMYDVIFRT